MQNIPQLSPDDRRTLLDYLVNRYTLEQVGTLLFVVGINRNSFTANATLPDLCTEVLQYCIGNGKLSCLLSEALRDKPEPTVQVIYARCPACQAEVKVEITIHDAGMKDLAAALKAFMEAHGLKANEVSLVAAAAGSLKILLSVPTHVADGILTYPESVLAGGRLHVDSVRAFRNLSAAEQAQWQQAAQTTPCADISTLADGQISVHIEGLAQTAGRTLIPVMRAAGTGLSIGRVVVLIFIIVVAGGIGGGVLLAPSLTIHNNCGRDISLPSVPLIGDTIGKGDSTFKILPGDYTISRTLVNDSQELSITVPIAGTVSIQLDRGEDFSVMQDGKPVQVGLRGATSISVGVGSRVEATLCNP